MKYSLKVAAAWLAICTPALGEMGNDDMDAAIEAAALAGQSAAVFEMCGVGNTTRIKRALIKYAESCDASQAQIDTISNIANAARRKTLREQEANGTACPMSKTSALDAYRDMHNKLTRLSAHNTCGL
ncbi:hypothetical protein [Shinella sp.]|uniref:hypothetical protein n=1 Tax=Shinella sp. TaxID=1870904 RepID=UPI003F6F3F91